MPSVCAKALGYMQIDNAKQVIIEIRDLSFIKRPVKVTANKAIKIPASVMVVF